MFPVELWRKIMNHFVPTPGAILLLGEVNHTLFKVSQDNTIWQQCCVLYDISDVPNDNNNFKLIFKENYLLSLGGFFPIVPRIVPGSFLDFHPFTSSSSFPRLKICLLGVATKDWYPSLAQNHSNRPSLLGAILAYGDSFTKRGNPSRLCLGNVSCSLDSEFGTHYLELYEYIYSEFSARRWRSSIGAMGCRERVQSIATSDIFIFYYSPYSRRSFLWMKYRLGEVSKIRSKDLFNVQDQNVGSKCEGFTYKSSTMHRCQRYEVLPIVIVELTKCPVEYLFDKSTIQVVSEEEGRELSRRIDCPFIQVDTCVVEEVRAMSRAAVKEHVRMAGITDLKPRSCDRSAIGSPELFMNRAELGHCNVVETSSLVEGTSTSSCIIS